MTKLIAIISIILIANKRASAILAMICSGNDRVNTELVWNRTNADKANRNVDEANKHKH